MPSACRWHSFGGRTAVWMHTMLFEARPSCIDSSISSRILLWLQSHSIFVSKHTFFPGKRPVIHSGPRGAAALLAPGETKFWALRDFCRRPTWPTGHARPVLSCLYHKKNKGFPLILQYYCCLEVQIRPIFRTDYLITKCSLFGLCTKGPLLFPSTIGYWPETVRLGPNRVR